VAAEQAGRSGPLENRGAQNAAGLGAPRRTGGQLPMRLIQCRGSTDGGGPSDGRSDSPMGRNQILVLRARLA